MKVVICWCFLMMLMSGCGSLGGEDVSVTLASEMAGYSTESVAIQQTALIERTTVVETVQASGTTVAHVSDVNVVLAATVRANVVPTPSRRQVIVDAEDMGSSLDTEMMEDGEEFDVGEFVDMQVQNLGIARSVRTSDGCTNGSVTTFTDNDERIYFTGEVFNLEDGTTFTVDWMFEERLVYRSVWTSDYSAASECIWFYMTPDDAAFLPGVYSVTLFVNGNPLPSQQFSISIG